MARSLMVNPPVLLMDEPFGALDNLTRISIRKEFKALDELVKKTVIMVTHDVQEAFEMGDRICLMDKGEIKQIGTPEELLFHPANDFVADFFEEQRLQLELKSVLVSELLPEYSDRTITVWERMEQLLHADDKSNGSSDRHIESLMSAFSAYKKQ
ncbi:hypothetical protein [Pedobacter sp. NJ-S-72]